MAKDNSPSFPMETVEQHLTRVNTSRVLLSLPLSKKGEVVPRDEVVTQYEPSFGDFLSGVGIRLIQKTQYSPIPRTILGRAIR